MANTKNNHEDVITQIEANRTHLIRIEKKLDALLKSPVEEVKEWVPKVGDLVVVTGPDVIGGTDHDDIAGVQPINEEGVTGFAIASKHGRYWFPRSSLRPATPEEITTYEQTKREKEEAEKLSKLKFGVAVKTPEGEGFYHFMGPKMDKRPHFIALPGGSSNWFPLSDITII